MMVVRWTMPASRMDVWLSGSWRWPSRCSQAQLPGRGDRPFGSALGIEVQPTPLATADEVIE
jgi:hypothetical protein